MGITSPLDGNPSEVLGGLRVGVTPLQMADAYATLANGGNHAPATIINKVVFPDGQLARLRERHAATRVFPYDQAYAADQVLKQVDHQRHRHGGQLRLPGGRQDRHGQQPRQRVVRRLHAADLNRGLGRLPAGQHPDERRVRRHAGGADLERLHGRRLRRLLRRLAAHPTCPFEGKPFFGPFAVDRSTGREPQHERRHLVEHHHDAQRRKRRGHRDVDEPVQQPDALPAPPQPGRARTRLRRRPNPPSGPAGPAPPGPSSTDGPSGPHAAGSLVSGMGA